MRIFAGLAVCCLLVGCSSLGTSGPSLPNVSFNNAAPPAPTGYLPALRDYIGPGDALVSQPLEMSAWSAFDPPRWYVCARWTKGAAAFIITDKGELDSKIDKPGAALCAKASYTPLP